MPFIAFKSVSSDDDGMLQIDVTAANSYAAATMDVYLYPDEIENFATELERFPTALAHEVVLESGSSDPKWYGHLRVRVYVMDRAGHSAVEVLMDRRGKPPGRASHHFYLTCNPADMNELGRRLKQWISHPAQEVRVEWHGA